MKNVLKYVLVWIIFILALNLYMFLGSLIPKNIVLNNIKESATILNEQGNSKYVLWVNIDNFTDAIIINQEYSIDSNAPLYSYMSARRNYDLDKTTKTITDSEYTEEISNLDEDYTMNQVGTLKKLVDGKIDTATTYARYWHGFMPVLRVLLIFMNISEIRIFNFIVLLCLLIYFLYLVSKKFGVTIAFIFAYSLIVYDYLFVSFSISAVSVYLIFMIASIILLKNIEKIKNLGIYFFLIGCFTSSMDLLSVPLLTLVIPLFICILNDKQNNTQSFGKIFKYCVLWAIGYGLTWISKWVIYDLIYHQNIILNALETTRYRASQTGDYSVIIINIIKSLVIDFSHTN